MVTDPVVGTKYRNTDVMWLQRKKPVFLTALAAVAVCAIFALTWLITRHFAVCADCDGVSDMAKAHIRNVFIAAAGIISLAAAGILFYITNKKNRRMKNFVTMDKINEELLFISTERTRIAARLAEQERLFETVIGTAAGGIFWKDSDAVYRGCNENYAGLIGLDKPESIIGKTDFDIEANTQQGDVYLKCDREVMKTGIPLLNMEETRQRTDGTETNMLTSKVPMRDADGEINGVMGICTDVAELAGPGKTSFIAGISRQICTPMNNIARFADLLEQEKLTAKQDRFVQMIAASAENILSIIAEIIDLPEEEGNDSGVDEAPAHTTESIAPVADDRELNSEVFKNSPHIPVPLDDTDSEQHAILVVDDVLENRMLLDTLLKKAGYNLSFAANGYQAVKRAESAKFDVILMDIQMAGMNGLEATRRIHAHGLNANTPIMAMTASITEEDEALCFDAGCDDFIRKPIKKDLLMRKIWRFIQQQEQIEGARRGGEITSFLANDPDYQKTIVTFIGNLPARITEMQQALDEENLQELAFKAHALKGLGGFAGFPIYTEMAKSIEKSIKESELEEIRQKLDEMVALCQRTRLPKE